MQGFFQIFTVLGSIISTKMSGDPLAHLRWVTGLFVLFLAVGSLVVARL